MALAQSGMSQGELARQLGCDLKAVRRLVDLRHRSHVDEVERALDALKRRVLIAGWSHAAMTAERPAPNARLYSFPSANASRSTVSTLAL